METFRLVGFSWIGICFDLSRSKGEAENGVQDGASAAFPAGAAGFFVDDWCEVDVGSQALEHHPSADLHQVRVVRTGAAKLHDFGNEIDAALGNIDRNSKNKWAAEYRLFVLDPSEELAALDAQWHRE